MGFQTARSSRGGAFLAFILVGGCDSNIQSYSFRALEVHCDGDGLLPLDDNFNCKKFARIGGLVEVSINSQTRTLQVVTLKEAPNEADRRTNSRIDYMENFMFISSNNWKCSSL
jgi:hypothetical protein